MNPFDTKLEALDRELKQNSNEAALTRSDFNFFETFNETTTRAEILALIDQYNRKKNDFDFAPSLSIDAPTPGFFGWVSDFVGSFDTQENQAAANNKRVKAQIEIEIAELDAQIKDGQAMITRYKSLDEHKLRAMIKTFKCREEIIQGKIQSVAEKREKLQQSIGPLLENAAEYHNQVRECEEDLKACQAFAQQLSTYQDNPANRRKVHEACAERFNGNGRPYDVAQDLNKKLEATRRQLTKIEERIEEEVKKMDIVIKRIFIDGNNLCFKRNQYKNTFIGTKAIESIATALLQKGMEVTVVFDHYIGKGKDRLSFDQVKQNFEQDITVHQAPPDTTADLVLMMMARDKFDCVISNDRFTDHGERSVVKEKRIFRAVVTESLVSVPMFNLEVSF